MKYRFRAARSFRNALKGLSREQKRSAFRAFTIFKENPFDPRLRAHKIHRLSARYKVTIYAVEIEGDFRATFYVEGNTVWSVNIGTHAIYRP